MKLLDGNHSAGWTRSSHYFAVDSIEPVPAANPDDVGGHLQKVGKPALSLLQDDTDLLQ